MIFEVGRVCIKTAGRDAGKVCVIIESVDEKFVMIEGDVRRRKISIAHLEPTKDKVKVKKGATHSETIKALKDIKHKVEEKKKKEAKKDKAERPRKARKKSAKPKAVTKKEKKAEKTVSKKKAEKKE